MEKIAAQLIIKERLAKGIEVFDTMIAEGKYELNIPEENAPSLKGMSAQYHYRGEIFNVFSGTSVFVHERTRYFFLVIRVRRDV